MIVYFKTLPYTLLATLWCFIICFQYMCVFKRKWCFQYTEYVSNLIRMFPISISYWVLLIKMWPVWARLIVAPPARGHLEVTLSVFLDSGGSWSFFVQEIYIKSNVRLSKNTHVFEPSFSDIYFTGWFEFSFIFSVFSGLTAFISVFGTFFAFLFFY